jgi:hypothetical protein
MRPPLEITAKCLYYFSFVFYVQPKSGSEREGKTRPKFVETCWNEE